MIESKATTAARLLLGLIFTVFGLNGFLNFIPMPPPEGAAGEFMGALAATGYMFPLIKGTEVVAGVLLLVGRAPALALLLLSPIVVNILMFHLALAPAGLAMALVLVVLEAYLGWKYWPQFRGVLSSPRRAVTRSQTSASAHS